MTAFRILRPPVMADAKPLFPLIYQSSVTRSIGWDGPESEQDFDENWTRIVQNSEAGQSHFFVIMDSGSQGAVGACDVRPDYDGFRGSMGLWVGERFQNKGLGTRSIGELVEYAFGTLRLCKLDASIFVDNVASRRAFEKNGFALEGTIRCASLKAGQSRDEWHLGLVNPQHSLLR